MKNILRMSVLSALALLLDGCLTPRETPYADLHFQPAAEAPAEYAGYIGPWEIRWDGLYPMAFAITSIEPDGKAKITYYYTANRQRFLRPDQAVRYEGRFNGNVLTFPFVTVTFGSDDFARAHYKSERLEMDALVFKRPLPDPRLKLADN